MRVSATRANVPTSSDSEQSSENAAEMDQGRSDEGSSSDDENGSDDDKEDMLAALEAYNRSMFGLDGAVGNHTKVKGKGKGKEKADLSESDESEQEDGGAGGDHLDDSISGSEDSDDDEEGEFYDEDDDFAGIAASETVEDEIIPTVVYADTGSNTVPKVSKADYKRFMVSALKL